MREYIENEPKRLEKIKLLKEKILKEIEQEMKFLKDALPFEIEEDGYEKVITQIYQLIELKKFINKENAFCSIEFRDIITKITIYSVSINNIDIWLQDSYNFVSNYLLKLEGKESILFEILDDRYFGLNFTNIFDKLRFDKKEKEKNENEAKKKNEEKIISTDRDKLYQMANSKPKELKEEDNKMETYDCQYCNEYGECIFDKSDYEIEQGYLTKCDNLDGERNCTIY